MRTYTTTALLLSIITMVMTLMSGCQHSYYQIYTVKPVDVSMESSDGSKVLAYEDDVCRVTYDFWGQSGRMSFAIYNKTDSTIFIDMPASHFVINDLALDYYQDKTETYSVSYAMTATGGYAHEYTLSGQMKYSFIYDRSFQTKNNLFLLEDRVSEGYSTSVREREIVMIPPHTYKSFYQYNICNLYLTDGDKKSWSFTKQDSPVVFRNFITLFVGLDKQLYTVDNAFYVSNVGNPTTVRKEGVREIDNYYPPNKSKVLEDIPDVSVRKDGIKNKGREIDNYYSPNQFYVVYIK